MYVANDTLDSFLYVFHIKSFTTVEKKREVNQKTKPFHSHIIINSHKAAKEPST